MTDAEGGYRLDAPAAGEYVLLISAGSHLPTAAGVTVRAPTHGRETVVNVLLAKMSGLIAGTVTAVGSGPPVAGACVTLTDAQGMVAGAQRTGPDGCYAFSGLKDGKYTLAVSASHYRRGAWTVIISDSGDAPADVGLAADTRLVVTTDGTCPVPSARITLLDDTRAVAAEADTDQADRYVIESVPGGEYAVIISGYPPTASALHITRRAGTVRHDIWLGHARADW